MSDRAKILGVLPPGLVRASLERSLAGAPADGQRASELEMGARRLHDGAFDLHAFPTR